MQGSPLQRGGQGKRKSHFPLLPRSFGISLVSLATNAAVGTTTRIAFFLREAGERRREMTFIPKGEKRDRVKKKEEVELQAQKLFSPPSFGGIGPLTYTVKVHL